MCLSSGSSDSMVETPPAPPAELEQSGPELSSKASKSDDASTGTKKYRNGVSIKNTTGVGSADTATGSTNGLTISK